MVKNMLMIFFKDKEFKSCRGRNENKSIVSKKQKSSGSQTSEQKKVSKDKKQKNSYDGRNYVIQEIPVQPNFSCVSKGTKSTHWKKFKIQCSRME